MTLREWLHDNGVTQEQMARAVHTRQQYISRWMNELNPSDETILKIKEITHGAVQARDWTMKAKHRGVKRMVEDGAISRSLLDKWQ